MTGQGSSKGNGASTRMANAKLKEKRQRSWTRGQARKLRNEKANEDRMKTNEAELAALGGTRRTYERVTVQRRINPKTGLVEIREQVRTKLESPGSALARTKREQREAQR